MKKKLSKLLVLLLVISMLSSTFAPAVLAAEPEAEVVDLESLENAIEEVALTEDPAEEAAAEPAEEPPAELSEEPAILLAEEPAEGDEPEPLADGTYSVGGVGVALGMYGQDDTDFSDYIVIKNGAATLVTRSYAPARFGGIWKGEFNDKPEPNDASVIPGTLIPDTDGSYAQNGEYKDRMVTLNGVSYKAAEFVIPLTEAELTAGQFNFVLRYGFWNEKGETWFGSKAYPFVIGELTKISDSTDLPEVDPPEPAEEPAGNIVMSFEVFDEQAGQVMLLRGPEKVPFAEGQSGQDLAEQLLGKENVNIDNGWMKSFTIDEIEYSPETLEMLYGSWLVYKNNANDSVGPADYKPTDGDVYRFVLTSYDPITNAMPVMPNDMSALYWAMAESTGSLEAANQLVQSENPSQADIDAMTATLSVAGGRHYVLIDERTIQVNTATNPYTYFQTLSADKASAEAGETVTVTVTEPEGVALVEGSLKANGTALTAGEGGKYTFVMPDAHVSVTAEFAKEESAKLTSAEFSFDENGTQPIELVPAFDKDVNEYAIDVFDFQVDAADGEIYSKVTFDAEAGTTAKWMYYMEYSGYGFYTDGPAAESGVAYGHSQASVMYPGMTNGFKHKIDVTTAGGTLNSYFFQMTMHPSLDSLSINGEELDEFEGDELTYDVTLPAGTKSAELLAAPFDEDTYYVYLNGGDEDIAGEETSVELIPGVNKVTITVDDDNGVTTDYVLNITVEKAPADVFKGTGTQEDPFQLATAEDMLALDAFVEGGETFEGKFLKLMADIQLPEGWNGVGTSGGASGQTAANANSKPFSGDFDGGDFTLTIPKGGKAVFDFVRAAKVHDLKVFGAKIDDYALVSNYIQDSSATDVVTFENVTLKTGSQTLYSGFIGGYAKGTNLVTIKNCAVEEGVVIGYDKQQSNIGGIAGEFNGYITDSTCAATVYGVNFVGGVVADKGQSMGDFVITGCSFSGTVEATGNYVGGICGHGYGGTRWGFTNNARAVTITDCDVTGTVTGANGVGGILGADAGLQQAWDNSVGSISDNSFGGKVTATGENALVGGIVGYLLSLNKNTILSNNYFVYGCGAAKGIGGVGHVDTNGVEGGMKNGTFYYDTSTTATSAINGTELETVMTVKKIAGVTRTDHNRTDDPLGADAADLCHTDVLAILLAITNNTNMFKADSAHLVVEADGSETLMMALSGTGYHYLYLGTYEEAVANDNNRDNWIAGYQNADGKWEFRIPLTAGVSYYPIVAISQSYLDKYENGQSPLARAFYPRQLEIDREAKTLVTGDYEYSEDLTVTVTGMTKIDAAALKTVGGPNSNGYKKTLEVTMGSTSYNAAFVGTPEEAGAEGAAIIELAEGNLFSIPVLWIEKAGQPDTVVSLMDAPIIISLRSAKNGTWYARRFVIDEAAKTLTVNSPAANAEVLLTVSLQGDLALARETVTVKDLDSDGVLTFDEALVAAHEANCPGGYELSEGAWGPQVSKLWGQETTACMFYINDAGLTTGVTVDEVKAGDDLAACALKDATGWSDKYTYFDSKTVTATAGKEFTLKLNTLGYDESWNPVVLPLEGASIGTWADGTFTALDKTTDAEGKVTLTLDKEGTVVVTAKGNDSLLISAPVCIVTVEPVKVKTTVSVLGDTLHDDGEVHTLKGGNLTEWVAASEIEVPEGSMVFDALKVVFEANGIEYVNDGNYISSVTFNGVTLKAKDNNPNSGWMFTYNGEHGDKGIEEQVVEAGSVIVFHWTDDYMQEDYGDDDMAVYAVIDMIDALPDPEELTLEDEEAVKAAREAYDALTDEQKEKVGDIYEKLLADEAKLEELKAADKVKVTSVSLTLKGKIGIYIYAQVPEGAATAKLTYPKTTEVKEYKLDKNKSYYIEDTDTYKFLYENVPAKELTQPLELQVFDEEGKALPITHVRLGDYGTKFSCKAVDYCNTILANPDQDAKLKDLVKAILNYGQCAQIQFEFDMDNLANPEGYMSEEMKTVTADPANDPEIPSNAADVGWAYGTLSLKGAINANLYFDKAITATDENGKAYKVTAKSNGKYVITVENIPAKNLGDKFTVIASYGGKTATIKYSALSYTNAVLGNESQPDTLKELCKAIILYNQYATAFFNK